MSTSSIEPATFEGLVSLLIIQVRVPTPLHAMIGRKLATLLCFIEQEVHADQLVHVPVLHFPFSAATLRTQGALQEFAQFDAIAIAL
jgi:hypothetical protein